jgi:hypothetical protein
MDTYTQLMLCLVQISLYPARGSGSGSGSGSGPACCCCVRAGSVVPKWLRAACGFERSASTSRCRSPVFAAPSLASLFFQCCGRLIFEPDTRVTIMTFVITTRSISVLLATKTSDSKRGPLNFLVSSPYVKVLVRQRNAIQPERERERERERETIRKARCITSSVPDLSEL